MSASAVRRKQYWQLRFINFLHAWLCTTPYRRMKSGCVAISTVNLSNGWGWVASFMLDRRLTGQTHNEAVWMRDCMVLRAGLVVLLIRKMVVCLHWNAWSDPPHYTFLTEESLPVDTPHQPSGKRQCLYVCHWIFPTEKAGSVHTPLKPSDSTGWAHG